MAAGVRDDVGHKYTCFMRGGEDARLHERFSGSQEASAVESRGKQLAPCFPVATQPLEGASSPDDISNNLNNINNVKFYH